MDAGTEQARGHLPDVAALVLDEHARGDGDDLVLAGTADALLAAVARQGVHGPGANRGVLVLEVLDQLGQGVLVQEVVQDLAAAHAHRGIGVPQPSAQGGGGLGTRRHQPTQGMLRAVLHREVRDQDVAVGGFRTVWGGHGARTVLAITRCS